MIKSFSINEFIITSILELQKKISIQIIQYIKIYLMYILLINVYTNMFYSIHLFIPLCILGKNKKKINK